MRPATVLLGALLSIGLQVGAAAAVQTPERDTIEALLERALAEREARRASLRQSLRALLSDFDDLRPPVSSQRRKVFSDALAAYGPDAGPLLVPYLDPEPAGAPVHGGLDEEAAERREHARLRARGVADALAQVHTLAVTDDVLSVLRDGSREGRANALRVLETSPEPARIRPHLVEAFETGDGKLQEAALRALIRVGGPEIVALLSRVLASDDDALVGLALDALIETGDDGAADEVRAVLARPARAERQAARLIAYYHGLPDLVDEEVLALFVGVARRSSNVDARLTVLAALPDLAGGSNAALRRALEPLTETSDRSVREAALVALVRLGDRGARRQLLRSYDDRVDRNENFADAYIRRGEVLLRIEDWDDAIRDFQQAIKLSRDDPRPQPDAYIGLARAYARRGRLKDAAEWVRKAPISMRDLRALADDPDFRELRDSRYGKDAFGL